MEASFMRRPLALYIHIPFCASKCAYCDFASFPGREDTWAHYLHVLKDEILWWSKTGKMADYEVNTLFVGGGTPSLLPAEMMGEIMEALRNLAVFAPDAEISMEANPGTLTPEKLAAYRKMGINRISFGAQSFDDDLLKNLGRIHSAEEIREAVRMARNAGFENINLDLMYALPGQTTEQWRHTLEEAINLKPEHVSAYSLIVEEGTPMAERVEKGIALIPEDEAVNAMQRLAVEKLAEAGYHRYEISNYALPDRECRHNLTYWFRGDYLGLGCAAHSMMENRRFANAASLDEYLSGKQRLEIEALSREDVMEETIMLSTRTCRGLDLAQWQRDFGEDFVQSRKKVVDRLIEAKLLDVRDDHLALTISGMEVQNAVVLALLGE